jgi:hypothetical protein
MEAVLKAPGCMLLKPRYDGPLSNFAFKFNLRRHDKARAAVSFMNRRPITPLAYSLAGAYTCPLFGST